MFLNRPQRFLPAVESESGSSEVGEGSPSQRDWLSSRDKVSSDECLS